MEKTLQIDKNSTAFFRFKKTGRGYLVTNDIGRFFILNDREFKDFVQGKLEKESDLYRDLANSFFIADQTNLQPATDAYRKRYAYLLNGPTLHIVVVTLRCNYKCVYCQANRRDAAATEYDMSEATAKNVVDRIFESPGTYITIEFQGGEPLLNWPVIRFIVDYSLEKNITAQKNLRISLVTNLSLMTDEIYDFLRSRGVSVCTSLDGPEDIHNKNRPCPDLNSYKATVGWIKKIRKKEKEEPANKGRFHRVNALLTITKWALGRLDRIIDEYVSLGLQGICLRRLSYLGLSGGDIQKKIGYTAQEFIAAWRDAMDYILKLNKQGIPFTNREVIVFLEKIFSPRDPGYLDLRSPCGAGIGQISYMYNGDAYSCDEARTLEDDTFLLGNVNQGDYQSIASSPKIKTLVLASTLENFSCDECVYKPYCGTCPVLNYVLYGTLFPQIKNTENCQINEAMLDYLFERMENKDNERILKSWIKMA